MEKTNFPIQKWNVLNLVNNYINEPHKHPKFLKNPEKIRQKSESNLNENNSKPLQNRCCSIRNIPKLIKTKKKFDLSNDFKELVVRTFFKENKLCDTMLTKEFGIGGKIAQEDYSKLIESVNKPKASMNKRSSQLLRPIYEEVKLSRSHTPNINQKNIHEVSEDESKNKKNPRRQTHKNIQKNLLEKPIKQNNSTSRV